LLGSDVPTLPREVQRTLRRFADGQPPNPMEAASLLVGFDRLMNEWTHDLERYLAAGGSLIRVVWGPPGSGKTHLGEALKAIAAQRNFLVCRIDVQSQHTDMDDLLLYRAMCQGLMLPDSYLVGDSAAGGVGLLSVLEDVGARMDGASVRAALRSERLPVACLRDILPALVDAIRGGLVGEGSSMDRSWRALAAALAAELPPGCRSIAALRRTFDPEPFMRLTRLPGKRDARLWLESLLRSMRPLGFKGVLLVLDEHDDASVAALNRSIVQLRQQLDRLAEGHLPGAFVLYLVLDDFPERVRDVHTAVEQRIRPLLQGYVPNRLMTEMRALRDDSDAIEFLKAVGGRLYLLVGEGAPDARWRRRIAELAEEHDRMGEADTRAFVKAFARDLLEMQ
jgi:hypothetical protein